MWFEERYHQHARRKVYLFIKTRFCPQYEQKALAAFAESDGYKWNIFMSGTRSAKGLILRDDFLTYAPQVAEARKDTLSLFPSWVMFDDCGQHASSSAFCPLHSFLSNLPDEFRPLRVNQVYLFWDEESPWAEGQIQEFVERYHGAAKPVFHFDGGRVFFIATREPGKITKARCESHLRGPISWYIVDHNHETFSKDGASEQAWQDGYLDEVFEFSTALNF